MLVENCYGADKPPVKVIKKTNVTTIKLLYSFWFWGKISAWHIFMSFLHKSSYTKALSESSPSLSVGVFWPVPWTGPRHARWCWWWAAPGPSAAVWAPPGRSPSAATACWWCSPPPPAHTHTHSLTQRNAETLVSLLWDSSVLITVAVLGIIWYSDMQNAPYCWFMLNTGFN